MVIVFQTENRIFQKKATINIKHCTIVIVVNQNLHLKTCNIELEVKRHTFEIRLKLSFKGCCSLMLALSQEWKLFCHKQGLWICLY